MRDFVYYNPVKIYFGKDKIVNISKEIPKGAKILIAYGGGSIKRNGVYDQLISQLSEYSWEEFGGIEPNPHYETLMKAVELIREKEIDFIIAVGGGSVIDATKFISAAVHYQGEDPWNIVKKRDKFSKVVPYGTVLTLPATGSEMNSGSVITRLSTKEKLAFGHPSLFAKFSILDPSYTATLPSHQAANGVVDAFIHVFEQYMTYDIGNSLQTYFSEAILMTLRDHGMGYYQSPDNYEHAANIEWAASWALNGMIRAGVPEDWSTHFIGHELTVLHNIDHAQTLAIVLPGVLRQMKEEKKERLLRYGKNIWGITTGSDDERIEQAIESTELFFKQLGMKSRLSDFNLGMDTINEIVSRFEKRGWMLGEHQNMTPEIVKQLLITRL